MATTILKTLKTNNWYWHQTNEATLYCSGAPKNHPWYRHMVQTLNKTRRPNQKLWFSMRTLQPQKSPTLAITGTLRMTPNDFINVHAGFLPMELALLKACHNALRKMQPAKQTP